MKKSDFIQEHTENRNELINKIAESLKTCDLNGLTVTTDFFVYDMEQPIGSRCAYIPYDKQDNDQLDCTICSLKEQLEQLEKLIDLFEDLSSEQYELAYADNYEFDDDEVI